MRIATEVLVEKYKDHLFAAAFNVCKNAADADDVVQDTFLQYHTTNRQFENEQSATTCQPDLHVAFCHIHNLRDFPDGVILIIK